MLFEDEFNPDDYKLVAPDVDRLLRCFDHRLSNPIRATPKLLAAVEPLAQALSPVKPSDQYGEVKSIWLRIPKGTIEDYESFEDMKAWGEVETYEEYETHWLEEYPEEYAWYELVVVQVLNDEGGLRHCGVGLGNESIISMTTEDRCFYENSEYYTEAAACRLCSLVLPAVQESIRLLEAGEYNALVASSLPYEFRTGIIKRSDLWKGDPEAKAWSFDGLSDEAVQSFKELVRSGANSIDKIGRIKEFTANDFFFACKLGYESIGKNCDGFSLSELYIRYSDGRDEGLTGKGHGLNEGPGIDFDDPKAWDEWFFHRPQKGGHPWEVVPGGNSTHVELYVIHDGRDLEWDFRLGAIDRDEFERRMEDKGYYFEIVGVHRPFEAVNFYLALTSAGLPVIIGDAEELIASFEGTDWVGIVPHHVFPDHCWDLFPEEYDVIVDYMHVFKGTDAWFDSVIWLPEKEAELL